MRNFDLAGFVFVLQLTFIFVAANLFGFVSWPWWLAFSPILVMTGATAAIIPGFFLVVGYMDLFERIKRWFE